MLFMHLEFYICDIKWMVKVIGARCRSLMFAFMKNKNKFIICTFQIVRSHLTKKELHQDINAKRLLSRKSND